MEKTTLSARWRGVHDNERKQCRKDETEQWLARPQTKILTRKCLLPLKKTVKLKPIEFTGSADQSLPNALQKCNLLPSSHCESQRRLLVQEPDLAPITSVRCSVKGNRAGEKAGLNKEENVSNHSARKTVLNDLCATKRPEQSNNPAVWPLKSKLVED